MLDRFGRVQVSHRKGAVGKDRNREALRFVLRLLSSRGSNGGRSGNLCSCSAKRTHESDVLLKGPNWISVPRGRTLTPTAPVWPYAFSVMELNPSDRGESEVQSRKNLRIRGEILFE